MSQTRKQQYDLYINTPTHGIFKAANAVCLEENGRLQRFGFRYTPEYLEHPQSISLDPSRLPLTPGELQFDCP